ncbi:dipeptidyl peptidase 2-like [Morone saxatilis]|uniref:dipeptidyl peptidase 2-like n=1 Tax=Morone saxatilis TaxID=34816 RepID=UPI0015E2486C|nr:dipeptidyl peptidase 2-like [Morone saxatilis]
MSKILAVLAVTVTVFSAEGLRGLPSGYCESGKHHGSKTEPQFKEKYFSQTLDHFNFNSMGNGTFSQRYLITDEYWKKGYGPIFFYTGNEGNILEFALNSGFITELAAQQRALVIFAEHVREHWCKSSHSAG